MRKNLKPAARMVMLGRPAKRASCVELRTEETDAPFHGTAPRVKQRLLFRRIPDVPVASRVGSHRNVFLGQLSTLLCFRPVRVVSEKMTFEGGFEQSVKTVDVMAVSGDLNHAGNTTLRGKKQMLTNTVKPAFQRGTVAPFSESSQTFLFAGAYGPANVYGMGVNDEKGGFSSPSRAINAFESFWTSGVRIARRSAQLGRLNRRGNNCFRVGFVSSHW